MNDVLKNNVIDASSLIIHDDEEDLLEIIDRNLKVSGLYNYRLHFDTDEFFKSLDNNIHVVVIDHKLLGCKTGLDIVREVKERNMDNFVIGYSSVIDPKVLIQYINLKIDAFVDKDENDHIEKLIVRIKEGLITTEKRAESSNYFKTLLSKYHDKWSM